MKVKGDIIKIEEHIIAEWGPEYHITLRIADRPKAREFMKQYQVGDTFILLETEGEHGH